jgi:hypothetical protein
MNYPKYIMAVTKSTDRPTVNYLYRKYVENDTYECVGYISKSTNFKWYEYANNLPWSYEHLNEQQRPDLTFYEYNSEAEVAGEWMDLFL